MTKSMTAYARAEGQQDNVQLTWEIRSVNHRYLDGSVYLPEGLQDQENLYKELMRKKLGRGKVDAKLVINLTTEDGSQSITLNQSKIKSLLDAQKSIQANNQIMSELNMVDILNWPGVVDSHETDFSDYKNAAKKLFNEALDELIKSRENEGGRLQEMITSRAKSIQAITVLVRKRRIEVIAALKEKLLNRLSELDVPADNNRLEQEMVYLSQRLDVDEELDRLESHIDELNAVFKRKEPIGRRLDFLMQELNREANTLASKSNDAETTKSAVELKVLIEQMREQVMNIE